MLALQQLRGLDPGTCTELIDAAGTDHFPGLLLSLAGDLGGVDEVFGYSITAAGSPCPLVSSSNLNDHQERVTQYSRRFFRQDPALRKPVAHCMQGSFFKQIRSTDIRLDEYRRLCFEGPGFVDKLSFYRRCDQGDDATLRLANLAEVALAALNRRQTPLTEGAFIEKLERRLRRSFPQLTNRETQTCARTIAGWNAERIARDLGLRPSSVLTYRQRAYNRSDCSSSHSFLPALMD
jgi:DNA-binding CsgD family transcriptional regulator